MYTLKVFLEIPDNIMCGLRDGTLVRDAAGVIRDVHGHIRAHLKEVIPNSTQSLDIPKIPTQPSVALGSMAAIAGVIILCTKIIYSKLNQIDKKLDRVIEELENIKEGISELYKFNILSLTENLFQARQFYELKDYEQARIACAKSEGSILNYIMQNTFEYHMQSLESLKYALSALALTVYLHCNAQNNIDSNKTQEILTLYENDLNKIMNMFSQKAEEYRNKNSAMTFRTNEELKVSYGILNTKGLKTNIVNAISYCESEKLAIEALQH